MRLTGSRDRLGGASSSDGISTTERLVSAGAEEGGFLTELCASLRNPEVRKAGREPGCLRTAAKRERR